MSPKISVGIPTYNSSATIRMTLESVLQQTLKPYEVVVVDDGSKDETVSLLKGFGSAITIVEQENQGVAGARNTLCRLMTGDLVAFLDHDDLWHPKYLENQCKLSAGHPDAALMFTGHVDFRDDVVISWSDVNEKEIGILEWTGQEFFAEYNRATSRFGSMSYCCFPRTLLKEMGGEPFKRELSGTEDSYFCYLAALLGPVVYLPVPLVAYRLHYGAFSANHVKTYGTWVRAFESLRGIYEEQAGPEMLHLFEYAFAAKRRSYAKLLMGAGRTLEARQQIRQSINFGGGLGSNAKSLGLLASTYAPKSLQPQWPSGER